MIPQRMTPQTQIVCKCKGFLFCRSPACWGLSFQDGDNPPSLPEVSWQAWFKPHQRNSGVGDLYLNLMSPSLGTFQNHYQGVGAGNCCWGSLETAADPLSLPQARWWGSFWGRPGLDLPNPELPIWSLSWSQPSLLIITLVWLVLGIVRLWESIWKDQTMMSVVVRNGVISQEHSLSTISLLLKSKP